MPSIKVTRSENSLIVVNEVVFRKNDIRNRIVVDLGRSVSELGCCLEDWWKEQNSAATLGR